MKFLRFIFFLAILFFIAFFFAGGTKVFDPQTIGNFREFFSPAKVSSSTTAPPAAKDELQDIPSLDRLSRVLFLKKAIAQKINKKEYITIDRMPDSLQHAVIAVEDNRFYSHHGFDVEGILRASLVNLQYGQIEEGASTITQQLVKNLFLSHERSFGRKAEELILALDMEANYPHLFWFQLLWYPRSFSRLFRQRTRKAGSARGRHAGWPAQCPIALFALCRLPDGKKTPIRCIGCYGAYRLYQ